MINHLRFHTYLSAQFIESFKNIIYYNLIRLCFSIYASDSKIGLKLIFECFVNLNHCKLSELC